MFGLPTGVGGREPAANPVPAGRVPRHRSCSEPPRPAGPAGILAGVIPAVGPVPAIGTLGTALLNAAGGAALAGIAGALVGWGIPEEDARYYEGEVNAGRHLVTVECGYGTTPGTFSSDTAGTTAPAPAKE